MGAAFLLFLLLLKSNRHHNELIKYYYTDVYTASPTEKKPYIGYIFVYYMHIR